MFDNGRDADASVGARWTVRLTPNIRALARHATPEDPGEETSMGIAHSQD